VDILHNGTAPPDATPTGGPGVTRLDLRDGINLTWVMTRVAGKVVATPSVSVIPGAVLARGFRTANVSTVGTTFATGADLLASPLSFTADGTSSYLVHVAAELWLNGVGGSVNFLRLNLDGADAGILLASTCDVANANYPCQAAGVLTPAAGPHTMNVRLTVSASTGTVAGSTGGANVAVPIIVTVEFLG